MIVVAMVVGCMTVGRVIVMSVRGVDVAMGVVVVLDRIAARAAPMSADQCDRAGENGAQQRQENDCLNHMHYPLRMISAQTRSAFVATENRCPLFRIMRVSPSSD